jgi:hypothetical protein
MTDSTPQADLKTQYTDRISEDLARNEAERARIENEITALQAELITLNDNRLVLERMQASLAGGTSEEPAVAAASPVTTVPVPAPVKKAAKKVPRQKSPAKAKPGPKPKPKTPAQSPDSTKTASEGPTLIELITVHLSHSEDTPRSASEVVSGLQQRYPGREFNAKVVRNTLEALVAKGRAERTRQKRSVFYVPVQQNGTKPAAKTADETEPSDTSA